MRKAASFAPLPPRPARGKTAHRPLKTALCPLPRQPAQEREPRGTGAVRLVLLGSPPDTVHGAALRGTDPSSPLTWVRRHNAVPGAGIHPCCSGLQVQGTANSPTSAAMPDADWHPADFGLYDTTFPRKMQEFPGKKLAPAGKKGFTFLEVLVY